MKCFYSISFIITKGLGMHYLHTHPPKIPSWCRSKDMRILPQKLSFLSWTCIHVYMYKEAWVTRPMDMLEKVTILFTRCYCLGSNDVSSCQLVKQCKCQICDFELWHICTFCFLNYILSVLDCWISLSESYKQNITGATITIRKRLGTGQY